MKFLNDLEPYADWFLRIAIASVFVFHGLLKFSNLEGFSQMLPISYGTTILVALAELVGGVLVIVGRFGRTQLFDVATRLGAAMQIPVMIGAISLLHWGRWNFAPAEGFPMGGMQFQVTLILVALYLVVRGNGRTGTPALA